MSVLSVALISKSLIRLSSLQGYLKLYQLSKPQIPLYDCLFIDEAQDLTPGKTDAG